MIALLQDIDRAWRFGTRPRDRQYTAAAASLFVVAGLGVALFCRIDGGPERLFYFALAVALTGGLLSYWIALANATVALNTPYAAWVAPGSRDRLVRAVVVTGAIANVLSALGFGLAGADAWLIGLGIACAMAGIVVSRTGRKLAGICIIELPILAGAFMATTRGKALLAQFSATQVALVLTVAVVALLRWTVRTSYPGDSAGAAVIRRQAEKAPGSARHDPRFTLWLTGGLYRAVLRFDLRSGAGLQHVLGPTAHWTLSLGYAAIVVAGCAALKVVGQAIGADDFVAGFGSSMLGLLIGTFLFQLRRYALRIGVTRTEQALGRLTPAAPAPADFNRVLGKTLLASALLDWLILGAGALLLAWLFQGGRTILPATTVLALWCALLPLSALALHDYGAAGPESAGRQTAISAAVLGALAVPTALLFHFGGVPFWQALLGCSAVLAPALIWERYRRMVAAPVAFPAAVA